MIPAIDLIKGIHPGLILGRELKSRSLPRGRFAISIGEFPQTLGAIIGGKRKMNTALALKIEEALGVEEGYFMTLQVFYDIKCEKQRQRKTPDLSKFRPALFWDTDINTINWQEYKDAVISRVFERGNIEEQEEIRRFYGDVAISKSTNQYKIHNFSQNETTL
ncbi:MAG: plasmid maintenance system antidote protein [Rikenellaceae bacterium]